MPHPRGAGTPRHPHYTHPRLRALCRGLCGACVAALLLAGCGGGGAGSAPEWLRAPAQPVTLRTTLENDRAASRVVTPAGGTLTATGSDGTHYRLRIPRDALLSDQLITLVPVRSVTGLPLRGGSVAAVHLEPSGLQLLQPATLTIRPVRQVPAAEQVAFGYYGSGHDAHQYPLTGGPGGIEMRLFHFSGYGFGQAAPGDPGRQALQRASSDEARMRARIADILGRERARQLGGEEAAELGDLLSDAAIEYHDAVLRPLMRAAEADDRLAECCMQRYYAWERQIQLFGMGPDSAARGVAASAELERRRAEANASSLRIMENAYQKGMERAVRRCREEHDLRAVTTLLFLERRRQLLGGSADGPEGAAFDRAFDQMRGCFSFEVEFSSAFATRGPGVRLEHHVQAKVPYGQARSEAGEAATAPLRYVQYTAEGNASALFGAERMRAAGTRPGTMTVERVEWNRNLVAVAGTDCEGHDEKQERTATDTVTVTFRLGAPVDRTHYTFGYRPPEVAEGHGWSDAWAGAHPNELVSTEPARSGSDYGDQVYRIVLTGREPGLWRADFRRTDNPGSGLSGSEHSYLLVRHTPR